MVRYIAVGNKKMRKKKSLDGPALLFLEQEIYWKLKLVVMCCFSFLIFTQIMFENQIFGLLFVVPLETLLAVLCMLFIYPKPYAVLLFLLYTQIWIYLPVNN